MSPSNGTNIIIVGAGYAGLAAAIELARRGVKVQVFEAVKQLTNQGDVIQIASNATRVMKKWGNVLEKVSAQAAQPSIMKCQNEHGELLIDQNLPPEYDGFPNIYCNRGLAQKGMYDHAVSLGVQFHFGARVTRYFDEADHAGVYVGDEKHIADAVLVGDGVHSKARGIITGKSEAAKPSGFAVYRSWFPMAALEGDPLLKHVLDLKKDVFWVWIGKDTHAILVTNTILQTVVCFLTHKDPYTTVEESWSFPGKLEDMLKACEGWDETIRAVIKRIPPEILIDWKLLWRDPAKNWVSQHGRLVLVGDSAHPHLATSGQGGAQAIEDGATLGALVDKAGKENIPLALRAFEKLRYERTSLTQRMGWELRHRWHQTDWDFIKKNPGVLQMPQPAWLFGADAEAYAYENYDAVTEHLQRGTPFKNTNLPEGYVHEDWTVETMMALEKEQAQEEIYVSHKETAPSPAVAA